MKMQFLINECFSLFNKISSAVFLSLIDERASVGDRLRMKEFLSFFKMYLLVIIACESVTFILKIYLLVLFAYESVSFIFKSYLLVIIACESVFYSKNLSFGPISV